MAGSPDLSILFDKEPQDVISYFESKGYKISFDWREVWQDAQAQAFTVSSVAKLDILEDIREKLTQAMREGRTGKWFEKELTPILQEKGWWGKRVDVGPDGTAQVVNMGSPARLDLIYQQNMRSAHMAARYQQMLANADNRPFWMYEAVNDELTRPDHAALHGLVFPYDDPFWHSHYPPNGFRCRCKVSAVNQRYIDKHNIKVSSSQDSMVTREVEQVDRRTGEIHTRQISGYKMPDGRVVYTDLGFSYNPGRAAYSADMEMARKLSLVQDTGLRAQAIQAINNQPLRHRQFAAGVDKILDSRMAGKGSMVVGFINDDVANFVRAKGFKPAQVAVLPEKSLLHADRPAHHKTGVAVNREHYRNMPYMLANPEMVLWDIDHNSVVYVYPYKHPNRKIIMPIEMPAQGKRRRWADNLDAVANIYITPLHNLKDVNKFQVIKRYD